MLFFFNFSAQADAIAEGWTFITKKKEIDIYSKSTEDSPIKALRVIGPIHGNLATITSILRNVEDAKNWVPNLGERSYVQNISDTEAILYEITLMPWPVDDRELVVHHKLSLSADKKAIVLHFKSVEHKDRPITSDRVRAKFVMGKIKFSYLSDIQTNIDMILLVDPMGKIPKWMVNLLQVRMPYDFINALSTYAQKGKKETLPGIQKLIDQLQ